MNEQRVNVIVDLDETPAELGDGYRVTGRIVVWEKEDVLKIPSSALFRIGESWGVFVVEEGLARSRAGIGGTTKRDRGRNPRRPCGR